MDYVIAPINGPAPSVAALESLRCICLDIAESYTRDHIWQCGPGFHLFASPVGGGGSGSGSGSGTTGTTTASTHRREPVLRGCTTFGSNIEDEWLIVFLLMEITRRLPGVVARVWDNDGEFLLIESAEHLPAWCNNPATATGRAWIYNGLLYLACDIPKSPADIGRRRRRRTGSLSSLSSSSTPLAAAPSLAHALQIVREAWRAGVEEREEEGEEGVHNHGHSMMAILAPPAVNAALEARLEGFPDVALTAARHHARCYLPELVCRVLRDAPDMVAPAAVAFFERDARDMKACMAMRTFRPSTRVFSRVRFTRCLYAQLSQQRFRAPAVFGKNCGRGSTSNSSSSNDDGGGGESGSGGDAKAYTKGNSTVLPSSQSDARPFELGVKLACGFEILAARGRRVLSEGEGGIESDERWPQYRATLEANGWFGDDIEGSAAHTRRLQEARNHFLNRVIQEDAAASDGQEEEEAEIEQGETVEGQPGMWGTTSRRRTGLNYTHLDAAARALVQMLGSWESGAGTEPYSEPSPRNMLPDDSESWLQIQPETLTNLMDLYQVGALDDILPSDSESENEAGQEETGKSEQKQQPEQQRMKAHGGGEAKAKAKAEAEAAARAGGEAMGKVVDHMKGFIDHVVGMEGAEVPDPSLRSSAAAAVDNAEVEANEVGGLGDYPGRDIEFDPGKFLSLMESLLGSISTAEPGSAGASTAVIPEANTTDKIHQIETVSPENTGPSSSGDAVLLTAAMEAMDAELEDTAMADSFDRHPAIEANGQASGRHNSSSSTARGGGGGGGGGGDCSVAGRDTNAVSDTADTATETSFAGADTSAGDSTATIDSRHVPVDVDFNLVKNLLDSYSGQLGHAGPTSTLLGAMGLRLPDEATENEI